MKNTAALSILSMINYILLAPIMTLIISILGLLAVITSVLTSSFISIRLVLLATEFVLGLTLCSASHFLSWIKHQCIPASSSQPSTTIPIITINHHHHDINATTTTTSHKHNFNISMPPAPSIKKMYSKSVPNTPDPTRYHTNTPFAF